jgi:hypothetical protein
MNLREPDLETFAKLRIPAELVERAGIVRVTDREAREVYGIRGAGDMSGIAFPYFEPASMGNGSRRWYVRIRRDHPEIENGREKKKYVAPYGDRKHFYFSPTPELFTDVSVPIILVEAEKSSLALTAWSERTGEKILPLAMGGCWGWRGQTGMKTNAAGERVPEHGSIPDLGICRDGRKVSILLDANCGTNPRVGAARDALAQQLRKQGAQVHILNLPMGEGINGPDDYVALKGDDALAEVLKGDESGSVLLDDLEKYYRKYIRVAADEYTVLAAWVLHCHAFKAFSRTPYVHVSSATNGCGKTQLLEITEVIVPDGLLVSSTTSAVLARAIDAFHPVLLMDELDQLMAGDKDLLAAVLATINSGYKKSGYRLVLEPAKGGGWTPRRLSTFSPKMLSGISSLPAVTLSRCIPITMERMLPDDRVAEIDEFILEPEAAALFTRARKWTEKNGKQLREARPDAPSGLGHRQREVARPLFAIGDVAGGTWPERIRSAVARLFAARDAAPSNDIKIELLLDIKQAFGEDKKSMSSKDLVAGLVAMEDRPWSAWGRASKPITPNQLARQLRDFKVHPHPVRDDKEVFKGYERDDFEAIWDRYLPPSDTQTVTRLHPNVHAGPDDFRTVTPTPDVTVRKTEIPNVHADCNRVTVRAPEGGRGAMKRGVL